MQAPKLQVALDTVRMEEAFRVLGHGLDQTVDIVEAGTMLLLGEGLRAVDYLRTIYPNKLLVADFKCVAPHFGSQVLQRNPNFATVLSVAEPHVKQQIATEALQRGTGQKVQVELYGDYRLDDVREWKAYGIDHVIYSRARSRSGPWDETEAQEVGQLVELGMHVTATGGMSYENLEAIAGLPVFAVICGRSVLNAQDPAAEALRIKNRMAELWGKA